MHRCESPYRAVDYLSCYSGSMDNAQGHLLNLTGILIHSFLVYRDRLISLCIFRAVIFSILQHAVRAWRRNVEIESNLSFGCGATSLLSASKIKARALEKHCRASFGRLSSVIRFLAQFLLLKSHLNSSKSSSNSSLLTKFTSAACAPPKSL